MNTAVHPETLAALRAFPDRLAACYAAIPRGFENWSPESWDGTYLEPFTPIEQLCHMRDIEIEGYHVRFRRVLDEHDPELVSIDGPRIARERAYAKSDAADVIASFRAARAKTLDLIASFTPAQLDRPARFEDRDVTLRGLVHFLCYHDQQHLSGIQWLLARTLSLSSARGH
jgi:hypothetical protein